MVIRRVVLHSVFVTSQSITNCHIRSQSSLHHGGGGRGPDFNCVIAVGGSENVVPVRDLGHLSGIVVSFLDGGERN